MKRSIVAGLLVLALSFFVSAEEISSVKSLYSYKLDNGLSLFVAENHSVPLTYIEVAVKCGSYTQTKETAGVFHLYEHMMFKGNNLYKDAAAVTRAMSDLGVANRNGTTDIECVNYYFTVPSEMTEKGLEFWNAAIRNPLMDKKEFEAEKKVVISEINGSAGEPGHIFMEEKYNLLFADAPYTMSTSGTEETVQNATIKQLKDMQKKYYVPNNAAVFVGGDVDPDKVYQMVKNIFGSWKKGKDPFAQGMVKHPAAPFAEPVYRVMPYDKISDQLAQVMVDFRGPDAVYDRDDTYAIDILSNLIGDPQGIYKQSLYQDPLIGIPDTDYVGGGYKTRKTCGVLSFYGMLVQPEADLAERAKYFSETLVQVMKNTAINASEDQLAKIRNRLEDDNIIEAQTASGLLRTLRFWWTTCDENYYYTYNQQMGKVGNLDLIAFVDKYMTGKNPLVTVLVSPKIYEQSKGDFEKFGFQEIKK